MIDINNISPMYSDFEQIKKLEEDGQEYWTSRELCNALGYSTYQKFTRILNKAIAVANGRGMKTADHFNQTVEMVKLGSGTFREVENMHLSRMACLIIAENPVESVSIAKLKEMKDRLNSGYTSFWS